CRSASPWTPVRKSATFSGFSGSRRATRSRSSPPRCCIRRTARDRTRARRPAGNRGLPLPPAVDTFVAMSTWIWLRASAARLFYRHFFRLLLVAASAAQWTVVVWVLDVGFASSLPWWGHVAAIGALYAGNLTLTRSRMRRRGRLFRVYTATAFVAMFCSVFLL